MSPPAQEPLKATLAPVVQALHQALGADLLAVALFGSRARGDAAPESDRTWCRERTLPAD